MKTIRFLLGVILPLLALGVELYTHICAQAFFDPIPTIWHALLIAFVVVGNFLAIRALASDEYKSRPHEAIMVGAVIGISIVYAARFMPILPLSCLGLLYMGFGALSFAPLMSLIVAIRLAFQLSNSKRLDKRGTKRISQQVMLGFLAGFLLLMLAEMPTTLTKLALKHAASENPKEARNGILMLRAFGNKNELLRMCYSDNWFNGGKQSMTEAYDGILGLQKHVAPDAVRKIFYRVTGTSFNMYEKPTTSWGNSWSDWTDRFDDEVAGEVVGGRVRDLSLDSSELQVNATPDAAVADVSWTMIFKNTAQYGDAEARTKIALPPGAVVSDLTLWINGVPQPAAFGSRSLVRSAYESVVRSMRDPVLVTTAGTDRVMMQCFPIRPAGGTLKTKIRFAIPLVLDGDKASLFLPRLVENNFDVKCGTKTSIVSSTQAISAPASLSADKPSLTNLKGLVGQRQLLENLEPVVFRRTVEAGGSKAGHELSTTTNTTSTKNSLFAVNNNGTIVEQKLVERFTPPSENVVVVVDGSTRMKDYAHQVAAALSSIPNKLPWSVVLAADEVSALTPQDKIYQELTPSRVAQLFTRLRFDGGPDNLQALKWATVLAEKKPNSTIVWVHGPQPVLLQEPDLVFPRDQKGTTAVYSLEVEPGSNHITEKLSDRINFRTVCRMGTVEEDLKRVFLGLINGKRELVAIRTESSKSELASRGGAIKPGNAIVKLWAAERVDTLLKQGQSDVATKFATSNRVVTPVSGAVVLEKKEDYKQAGLSEPNNPDSIPAAPEPEMWLLIAMLGCLMAFQMRARIQRALAWRS